MGLQFGDTTQSSMGSYKRFEISPIPFKETFLSGGNEQILPTTEPATSQVIYTLTQEDMPVITPQPIKWAVAPIIYLAGKSVTACTISYRAILNNQSIFQSSGAVPANNNWTLNNVRWFNAKVGDTIEMRVWSNQADTQFDFHGLAVYPSRLQLASPYALLKDLNLEYRMPNVSHTFTLGRSPFKATSAGNAQVSSSYTVGGIGPGSVTFPLFQQLPVGDSVNSNSTYGLFSSYFGDSGYRTANNFRNHVTYHPHYDINHVPNAISFREVSL